MTRRGLFQVIAAAWAARKLPVKPKPEPVGISIRVVQINGHTRFDVLYGVGRMADLSEYTVVIQG